MRSAEISFLVFKHFNIHVIDGLDATLNTLEKEDTEIMPRHVKECVACEILRIKGKKIDQIDLLLLSKISDDKEFEVKRQSCWDEITGKHKH